MANSPGGERHVRFRTHVEPDVEAKLLAGFEMLPAGWFAILVHLNGPRSRSIPADQDGITVGRGNTDICVDDPSLSQEHARVAFRHGAWFVEDLDSLNGTYVDSVRVVSCRLCSGDLIHCGAQCFRFVTIMKPDDMNSA